MSTLGDILNTSGDAIIHVRDIMSTGGYHKYIGRCSVHLRDIIIHLRDILSTLRGY